MKSKIIIRNNERADLTSKTTKFLKKGLNLFSILQDIDKKADINLNLNTDIDFITRIGQKIVKIKKTKPIIVWFLCRWEKDDFLSLVRKQKLSCNDLGFTSNNS